MAEPEPIQIIALNGAPHRDGNTVTVMGWVVEGCQQAGARVEWLHLVDYDIRYCRGCMACLRTGVCPIDDDMARVRDRLLAADGVIAGSPVYDGSVTARLKTIQDRITLQNLYTHLFFDGRRTAGVATSGCAPAIGVAKRAAGSFGRPVGAIGAKTAHTLRGFPGLPYLDDARLPDKARALGRRLVAEVHHTGGLPSPTELWLGSGLLKMLRPQVIAEPEQFAWVIQVWKEKGWL